MNDILEPLARNSDPATSHAAARRARRYIAPSHRERILGVLWRPLIPSEIARFTGLTVVQIDRRLPEMQAAGDVRLTGIERNGPNGTPMREWERVIVI